MNNIPPITQNTTSTGEQFFIKVPFWLTEVVPVRLRRSYPVKTQTLPQGPRAAGRAGSLLGPRQPRLPHMYPRHARRCGTDFDQCPNVPSHRNRRG